MRDDDADARRREDRALHAGRLVELVAGERDRLRDHGAEVAGDHRDRAQQRRARSRRVGRGVSGGAHHGGFGRRFAQSNAGGPGHEERPTTAAAPTCSRCAGRHRSARRSRARTSSCAAIGRRNGRPYGPVRRPIASSAVSSSLVDDVVPALAQTFEPGGVDDAWSNSRAPREGWPSFGGRVEHTERRCPAGRPSWCGRCGPLVGCGARSAAPRTRCSSSWPPRCWRRGTLRDPQRAAHHRRRRTWATCSESMGVTVDHERRRADHRRARTRSCPRRPTSWSRRCGRRSWCSARCSPAPARRAWRCPAATTSARARSTCTCAGLESSAPTFTTRHGYIDGRAGQLVGTADPARVPERRRHRERPHGRGAGQGHDGHRQRRTRARDRRPRGVPQPDGRARSSARARRRSPIEGVEELAPVEHTVDPRPHRGRDVPRRASAVAGGEITLVGRPPRPHGHAHAEARRDGHAHLARPPTGCGRWSPRRLRSVDVSTLPYPGHRHATTSRCSSRCWRSPTASASSPRTSSSGRFRYVDELVRMGADIRTEGHHAVVRGVAAALGRAGAGPRHPRRGGAGRRGAGGRGRDGDAPTATTSTAATRTRGQAAARRRRRRAGRPMRSALCSRRPSSRSSVRRRRAASRRSSRLGHPVGPPVGDVQQDGDHQERGEHEPDSSQPP